MMASVPIPYIGWRDLGPKRQGRVWKLHATPDRCELSRPPFGYVGHITGWLKQ